MRTALVSRLVFLAVIVAAASFAHAETKLEAVLAPLIKAHEGQVAVAVKHLDSGEAFTHRENEPMPTASLIKFPVMVEAYRQAHEGQLDLGKMIAVRKEDKVQGSGILTTHFSDGTTFPLRDAIRLMIVYSDNTATNLVLDQIGLPATAKTMEALGFPNTKIHAKVFQRETSVFPERSKQFGLGSTTAAEMVGLLERLHQRKLVSEQASDEMQAHLLQCEDEDKFPRFLPEGTKVAHKTGSVNESRTDAGIIYSPGGPIAVCVLTNANKDKRWTADNAGNRLCAEIARAVYQHFNPPGKASPADEPQILKNGSMGDLVEALQRTLNARISPAPGVSVDGDFGSETEAAVVRFQRSLSLAPTGIVGPETWKALGPLVTEEKPVPEPAVVNQQQLPLEPADKLSGHPFVTCKAWAIGDGKTGKLLWGDHDGDRLDFASTTKIMTAYVVAKLAEADPKLLDQEVVFSKRADGTAGSTAGIRAGEKLSARELLYGLLLPSGNDASVALAEHFGSRFDPPANGKGADDDDPLVRFVAEMNRTAKRLEMADTHYANPHGLPDASHLSTARDLLKLGWTALHSPLLRQYITTRQHGCRLIGPGGYQRDVVWKNSNKLLDTSGYSGIKTGTTTAAGACLVSTGEHSGDQLLVIVLGSTSSDARYTDTRNLYRWAWRERGHKE